MYITSKLDEIGLDSTNAVVIGSGILSALGLRESQDIDVVTMEEKYKELASIGRFKRGETHGRELLVDDVFEIGINWGVLDKDCKFEELLKYSTVIDGVRYNTLEFLLEVKRSRILEPNPRQKDVDDVRLIEKYITNN